MYIIITYFPTSPINLVENFLDINLSQAFQIKMGNDDESIEEVLNRK